MTKVHLFEDQVYGASRIDVHKINVGVVVNEFCTSCHSVGKAAFHLKTLKRQTKIKNATFALFRFIYFFKTIVHGNAARRPSTG